MENLEINTQDIGSYKLAIENLANKRESFNFTNSGAEHACVVMSNIFRTADTNVYLFAKNLNGMVSKGDYLTQLDNYLKKDNSKIDILLEENPSENSQAIEVLKKSKNQNIKISIANKELLSSRSKDKIYHFTIADNRMFRFETDTENYTAVCDFNDPTSFKVLKNLFEVLSVGATPLA
jgi:hypothetical protein